MRHLLKSLLAASAICFVIGASLIALAFYLDRLHGPPGKMFVIQWTEAIPLLIGSLCSLMAVVIAGLCGVIWIVQLLQNRR